MFHITVLCFTGVLSESKNFRYLQNGKLKTVSRSGAVCSLLAVGYPDFINIISFIGAFRYLRKVGTRCSHSWSFWPG